MFCRDFQIAITVQQSTALLRKPIVLIAEQLSAAVAEFAKELLLPS